MDKNHLEALRFIICFYNTSLNYPIDLYWLGLRIVNTANTTTAQNNKRQKKIKEHG